MTKKKRFQRSSANDSAPKKTIHIPHAYVLLLCILLFCTALTWLLPSGSFERAVDPELGRELVVIGSYQPVDSPSVGLWGLVLALYEGMVQAADIMFFIIFAAAYVFLLMKTGTLNAMIGALLRILGARDHLIIPIFMLIFAVAGSTFGMYEETYGLIPAFVVIAITLGYDRIVGGAIVFVGVATGFAAAILNPFTIGIASSVAGVPLMTPGITLFRIAAFVIFFCLSCSYVMRYASRVKRDPASSIMYGTEEKGFDNLLTRDEVVKLDFTSRQKATMLGFLLLILAMAYGIMVHGFYLAELSALFFLWMVATGFLNKMKPSDMADAFLESTKASMYGILIVGIARSVSVVMEQGLIIDTAVLHLSNAISGLPRGAAGVGMLVVQNLVNFFIPSGSGQAVVLMPIMAPLADLAGISRETAVLAYQFGDGFSNMFWPTAVALECGIMGISMDKWYRFITPLFIMMFLLQSVMITAGIYLGI